MDDFFMAHVKATTPLMNPDIVNGLAVKMLPKAKEHLDTVIRSVAKDFVPGLRFKAIENCTAEEELRRVNTKKNDKYVIDIAKSSLYLVKILLAYTDPNKRDPSTGQLCKEEEDLEPVYMFLPYVEEAGSIHISGVRYFISPVQADVVLSFEKNCVFLNLLRAKFSINDDRHTIAANGIYEEHKILWSSIYHVDASTVVSRVPSKPVSTLAHYLFCHKGLKRTFMDYGRCNPEFGTEEITSETHPPTDWIIYKSARQKLRGSRFNFFTPFKVAIRRSEINPAVEGLVAAFFYLLDHFPNAFENISWIDDQRKWKLMLGTIIFGTARQPGNLLESIDDHFKSLDQYLDTIVKYRLESIGVFVEDIYDFFAHAIENYNEWSIKSKENLNSIYDKELSILHYTLVEIVRSINTFYFKLKSASKTADGRSLTTEEINKILKNTIKPRRFFGITDNPSGLSNMAYPGDNKFMKITCNVVPQRSLSSKGNEDIDINDPVNRLHTSFMVNGSHLNLPKNSPIGFRTTSPYAKLDHDNKYVMDIEDKPFLDGVQEIIRRK